MRKAVQKPYRTTIRGPLAEWKSGLHKKNHKRKKPGKQNTNAQTTSRAYRVYHSTDNEPTRRQKIAIRKVLELSEKTDEALRYNYNNNHSY